MVAQAQPSIFLFMLFLAVVVILVAITIMFASKYGFGNLLKGILAVGIMLFLLAIPVVFWSRTSIQYDVAADLEYPREVAEVVRVAESASIPTPPVIVNAVAPSSSSADGELIGQSEIWSEKFECEHVADLYSSPAEAAKCIARQCAARLQAYAKTGSKEIAVCFDDGMNLAPLLRDMLIDFKSEFRLSAPDIKVVSAPPLSGDDKNQFDCVLLSLGNDVSKGPGGVRTYSVPLKLDDDKVDIVAKCVSKNWVKNDVSYRLSSEAPRKYIVALGDTGTDGKKAIEVAAERLEADVDHYITHSLARSHGYSSSEFLPLARVVASSLTKDKFIQNFTSNIDGSRAEQPVAREAILIDCTRAQLHSAIYAAKMGEPFTLSANWIPSRLAARPSSTQVKVHPGDYSRMAAVLLVCCGALKGVSWFFDGKSSRT